MKLKLLHQAYTVTKYSCYGIFLQCILYSMLIAEGSHAQKASWEDIYITVDLKNNTVEEALLKIEDLTDFTFAYPQSIVRVDKHFSLDVEDESLASLLRQISHETKLSFRRVNNVIHVRKKKQENPLVEEVIAFEKLISGKVSDENGEGIPGVNILIKNTATGTITDVEGNYRLNVPDEATTLVFSYVGYLTQEVNISGQSTVDITLTPDISSLSEVVVVGYGTQKKSSVTGAVSTMNSEEVKDIPVAYLSNALAGRISGVFVNQGSGAPGYAADIRVRSVNTWKDSGNEPLFVIDGVISDKRSFDALDYFEVESVTVLKDAASGAIYGARAANGVILVTTKTGKPGEFKLNYNYSYSFDKPSKIPEYMGAADMVRLNNYARTSMGAQPLYDAQEVAYFNENDPGLAWYNDAYQDPVLQKHSLTGSGGTEKVKYFLGASYFDQSAFVKNADFDKINVRSNLNVDFTENLSGLFKFSYNEGINRRFSFQEDFSGFDASPTFGTLWGRLLYYLPDVPPKTSDGKFINPGWIGNPLAFIEEGGTYKRSDRNTDMLIGLTYKLPFVDGLSVSGRMSWNYTSTLIKHFDTKPTVYNVVRQGTNGKIYTDEIISSEKTAYPSKERLGKSQETTIDYQLNLSANYVKSFGQHNFDAIFIYEQSEGNYDYFYGARENFPLLQKDQFWATGSSRNDSYVDGVEREYGRASFIGRISYNYDEKYFVNLVARRDGSMQFAPDYRWGTFPSILAGWVLSREEFFNANFVNFLKLRGSWGLTGNDAVGGWEWSESYSTNGDYLFGTSLGPRVKYNGIVNEKLTWEKTREWNIGFDSRFLNGFILNAEYYNRHNYDILDTRIASLPASFGGDMPPVNYGIVDAHGWEFELGYTGNLGEVIYEVKGNLSYATNKVKVRDVAENARDVDDPNGRSTDYVKMLVATDIIRTQDELDALPEGYTIYGRNPALGMINFEDVSGVETGVPDGKIDDYDQQVIDGKHLIPPYTFGLNLNADWRGLRADVFFQGVTGVSKLYNDGYGRRFFDGARPPVAWLDSWNPENTDASMPKPVTWDQSNDHLASTFWLKKGNYLRLQQVSLSYSFPNSISQKLKLSDLTFFLSGTNLITFTDFDYYDPSVEEMRTYPTMKTYTMGINVSF